MRSDAIEPGDIIAGKYRVRAIMSRSRGFLLDALHTEFDQRLAIRVLSPQLVDAKEVERFRREAQTLARLESEHAARILDVGTTPDGAFYFARQYLEGQDLASYLKQRGALALQEAVLYVLQAAEAVAETHAHDIVLRELQPSHLFLTQRLGGQQIKIIDFGTAKLMREVAAPTGEMTATASIGLSPYSSPELMRKAPGIDRRTDVWSLGAILYLLLTARPPFAGDMTKLMLAIAHDEPVPVTRLRRDLPPDLDKVIAWALAKDPERRFASIHAFAHALTPFAAPEAQVLIRRIGDITNASRGAPLSRPSSFPAPGPNAATARIPAYMAHADQPLDPDDARTAFCPGDVPVVGPAYSANVAPAEPADDASPLERTMFMGADYVASSPVSPTASQPQRPAQPLPQQRPAQPRPAAFAPAAVQSAPPPQPHPAAAPIAPALAPFAFPKLLPSAGPPPQPETPPRELGPSHPAAHVPAGMQTTVVHVPPPVPGGGAGKTPARAQKLALVAVAAAVLLLSVVAVIVVFKGALLVRGRDRGRELEHGLRARAERRGHGEHGPGEERGGHGHHDGGGHRERGADGRGGDQGGVRREPRARACPCEGRRNPAPDPAPAPAASDTGTLVAIAVGGTCAFAVNGEPKGTTATIKLSLKPGTYSVTCAPASGGSKSKSVTVTGGGTATAMFKL